MQLKEKNKNENVKLKEEDIPGRFYLDKNQKNLPTLKQLQRWLLCRAAKTTRKKMQLVQR